MKKLSLIALLATVSAPVLASSAGAYVQADLGYATVKMKAKEAGAKSTLDDKGFIPRVSVGYDTGENARVALDWTNYGSAEERVGDVKAKAKINSVGVSALYDIDMQSPITPYVGARLSANRIDFNAKASEKKEGITTELKSAWKKSKVGFGLLAGASYKVSDNIDVEAGYRYNYWGKFEGAKVNSHEVTGGVRYRF